MAMNLRFYSMKSMARQISTRLLLKRLLLAVLVTGPVTDSLSFLKKKHFHIAILKTWHDDMTILTISNLGPLSLVTPCENDYRIERLKIPYIPIRHFSAHLWARMVSSSGCWRRPQHMHCQFSRPRNFEDSLHWCGCPCSTLSWAQYLAVHFQIALCHLLLFCQLCCA